MPEYQPLYLTHRQLSKREERNNIRKTTNRSVSLKLEDRFITCLAETSDLARQVSETKYCKNKELPEEIEKTLLGGLVLLEGSDDDTNNDNEFVGFKTNRQSRVHNMLISALMYGLDDYISTRCSILLKKILMPMASTRSFTILNFKTPPLYSHTQFVNSIISITITSVLYRYLSALLVLMHPIMTSLMAGWSTFSRESGIKPYNVSNTTISLPIRISTQSRMLTDNANTLIVSAN